MDNNLRIVFTSYQNIPSLNEFCYQTIIYSKMILTAYWTLELSSSFLQKRNDLIHLLWRKPDGIFPRFHWSPFRLLLRGLVKYGCEPGKRIETCDCIRHPSPALGRELPVLAAEPSGQARHGTSPSLTFIVHQL